MKRKMTGLLAAALLVPLLTGCAGGTDFCEAAPTDIDTDDPVAMKEASEDIRGDAPEEIRDDVDVIIKQLDLVEKDPASIDVAAVQKAVDELTAWEEKNC